MMHRVALAVVVYLPLVSSCVPRSLNSLVWHVVDQYMTEDNGCVVVLSDSVLEGPLLPTYVPVFRLRLGWQSEEVFYSLLLQTLDAGCLAYIIQVKNLPSVIRRISQTARKGSMRANRRYLILPATTAPMPLHDLFVMKEMRFMPDLVAVELLGITESAFVDNSYRTFRGEHCSERDNDTTPINKQQELHSLGTMNPTLLEEGTCSNRGKDQHICDVLDNVDYDVLLVTHQFVGKLPQAQIILDKWNPKTGFENYSCLYPDKISDLQGKELILASFNYPPYTIVNETADPPVYAGTEFNVIREYMRAHNFTWRLVSDDELWGVVWENGSGNGLSGFISEDRADIAFGSMYLWHHEFQFFDFTTPYYRTAVTCLAPKPHLLPSWMVPLLPFTKSMWLAVGISLLISVATLYGLGRTIGSKPGRFTSWSECCLLALGMLVMQVPSEDHRLPLRYFVCCLLVVFLLLSSSYSGGLSSVLTVPRFEPPIDTVEDLALRDMPWAANHEAWVFSIKEATEPYLQRIVHNFHVLSDDDLAIRATQGDLAVGVERLNGGNFALGSYLGEEAVATLRLMSEDLYWGSVAMIARKGSPFMPSLNNMLGRLVDSGIPLHLEGEVVRQFLSQRLQLGVQISAVTENTGPTLLSMSHVQGAFTLLVLGLVAALATFIGECLYHTLCQTRRSK
ncbi:probable glutamate receptor [Anabrus simplex]|uniref:probable glutamate receptor n=1 Tax=Anabrus simplex TaxID=316456 RepID=UPI0035A35935